MAARFDQMYGRFRSFEQQTLAIGALDIKTKELISGFGRNQRTTNGAAVHQFYVVLITDRNARNIVRPVPESILTVESVFGNAKRAEV